MRGSNFQSVNLQNANLKEAILRGTNFSMAILEVANLYYTDLQFANLKDANLIGADLQLSDLREAALQNTILTQANLRYTSIQSYNYSKEERNFKPTQYTDLSNVIGLNQEQLDIMNGDTGVILPDGLHHPDHWPDWDKKVIGSNSEANPSDTSQTNNTHPTVNFNTQTTFLIGAAAATQSTADALAGQIEFAVTEFRKANTGNEIPDEVILFENLAHVFRNISKTVSDNSQSNSQIEALENQITDLKQIINELINASATNPTTHTVQNPNERKIPFINFRRHRRRPCGWYRLFSWRLWCRTFEPT